MKGSILGRGKGTNGKAIGPWRITVSLGKGQDGKYRSHRETVKGSKSDAQRRLREILQQIDSGLYVPPTKLTVGQYLQRWAATYAALHTSPRTAESYQDELERHIIPALGDMPLAELRPHHIEAYYVKALASGRKDGKGGLSPRTAQYHHQLLSQALEHAVRQGELARNPAKLVTPPRPSRCKIGTLAPEDVKQLLAAATASTHFALILTALYTGARLGELLALQWRNVDLRTATMRIQYTLYRIGSEWHLKEPKSARSRRQIDLPHPVVSTLQELRREQERIQKALGGTLTDSGFVFAQYDGKPRDKRSVERGLERVLRAAGLPPIRFHDLRHTHASLMLSAGVHPKAVSERLGHGSVAFTLDTYSHVMPGVQKEAVSRFEALLLEGGR